MFCPNCGTQNAESSNICTNCGAPLAQQNVQQPAYQQPTQPVYQQPTYQQPAQPVYQQPVYQQPMYQAPSVPGKGLGITSMVIGIVSLALFCTGWIAVICAIVGVALGGVGLYKAKQVGMNNGMAVAGLACSIVALGILIILIVSGASAAASFIDLLT